MTHTVTCPQCSKRLYDEPTTVMSLVQPNFSHSCGFRGTLRWDTQHGTERVNKRASKGDAVASNSR